MSSMVQRSWTEHFVKKGYYQAHSNLSGLMRLIKLIKQEYSELVVIATS